MEVLSSGLTGSVCTASSLPDHVGNWSATSGPERKRELQGDTYASLNLHLVPELSFAYWNFTTSPCRLTQDSKSQWCLPGRAIWQEGHANKLNKINCKHTPWSERHLHNYTVSAGVIYPERFYCCDPDLKVSMLAMHDKLEPCFTLTF